MKLYNTLSRKVEDLKPLNPPAVTLYTCGPTVYDYPHIGNWFTFVRYDLLVRTLKLSGLNPQWVLNITDVGHLVSDADEGEDKLEKGARREGKTAWDVADYYTQYFLEGLQRLDITQPTYTPKATNHISEQIELIKKLDERGFTYTINDGIYYDTAKFPRYAKFAKLDLDEQQAGARVEYNSQKRNPTDFALWKFSPQEQARDMEWDSPWGKGFPGWHLECSAMGMKYLGETIDVHAGGIDHIPVHHTNEIAQTEAITNKPLANYWMHTNHITVEGEKISKSLGNGITLEDVEKAGFSLMDLRMHMIESHYRSQSKFSWESLRASHHSLKNVQDNFSWIYQSFIVHDSPIPVLRNDFARFKTELLSAMQDDLNTPRAVALLHECSNGFAVIPASQLDKSAVEDFDDFIYSLLGIRILDKERYDLPAGIKQKIKEREAARARKDWQTADIIKETLLDMGLDLLKDTEEHGSIWYRTRKYYDK